MSTRRRIEPGVERMDSRVLLSAMRGVHLRRNVDVSGEVMRMDLTTPPKTVGRTRVYAIQGQGGVDEMGSVQVHGTATDSGRGGTHAFKGTLVLSNGQGTVTLKIMQSSYRISGGTGAYRGATGLGVVTYGTSASGELIGMAFSGDH